MGLKGHIEDKQNGDTAKVTSRGQLVVAPLAYSSFFAAKASVDDVPVNIVPPKTGMRFVCTAMIINADKSVTSEMVVTLFEGSGPTTTTQDQVVFSTEILKQRTLVLTGLNVLVTEGKWLNGVTDDNNALFNVAGYYVKA